RLEEVAIDRSSERRRPADFRASCLPLSPADTARDPRRNDDWGDPRGHCAAPRRGARRSVRRRPNSRSSDTRYGTGSHLCPAGVVENTWMTANVGTATRLERGLPRSALAWIAVVVTLAGAVVAAH